MVTVMALFDEGKSNNFVDYSCLFCIGFISTSRICCDLYLFSVSKEYSSLTQCISLFFISGSIDVLEIAVVVPVPQVEAAADFYLTRCSLRSNHECDVEIALYTHVWSS